MCIRDRLSAASAMGQGADDIVSLVAITSDTDNPQGLQRIHDQRHLRSEVFGALLLDLAAFAETVRLVRRDGVDPKRRSPVVVPAGHQMGRVMGGDQCRDHVQKAAYGIRGRLLGAASVSYTHL